MKKKLGFAAIALAAFWLGACNHGGSSGGDSDSINFANAVNNLVSTQTSDRTEPLTSVALVNIGQGAYNTDEVDEPISA